MFTTQFRRVLDRLTASGGITTIVDLFGGSGLLAHTAKRHLPGCRVIYNDYDNYRQRLDAMGTTNEILTRIRGIVAGVPKGQRLDGALRSQVLGMVAEYDRRGFVDYITLSSSILFAQKYVLNYAALCKETLYCKVRKENYDVAGYLDELEVVSGDYKEVFERFRGRPDVLFLVDPPYLSTDTSTYGSDKYWHLRDYLDVLHVLSGGNYVYFTSNKSQIVELVEWMEANHDIRTVFTGATVKTHEVKNYACKFTDMMLYKGREAA